MRRVATILALGVALTAVPRSAAAEEHPAATQEWYGWQTLTADGAAIALMASGIVAGSGPAGAPLGYTGMASYVVTPAVIHGAHGHVLRGVGDAAIRVVTPVLGTIVGAFSGAALYASKARPAPADGANDYFSPGFDALFTGAAIGFLAGVLAASAIDAAVLARDDAPAARPAPSGAVLRPVVAPSRGGVSAGLTAVF